MYEIITYKMIQLVRRKTHTVMKTVKNKKPDPHAMYDMLTTRLKKMVCGRNKSLCAHMYHLYTGGN